jgi:hypothetical protein
MAQGTTYAGGLAEVGASRTATAKDNYKNFLAIEYSLSSNYAILLVAGDVRVGNPGIEAVLHYAVPQGINPKILVLDLSLKQRPGVWPAVETWDSTKYVRISKPGQYDQVEIRNKPLGNLMLKVIHLP